MPEMERLYLIKDHSREIRDRRKCDACGRRRLCTRETLSNGREQFDKFFCNPCLTSTPPWGGSR